MSETEVSIGEAAAAPTPEMTVERAVADADLRALLMAVAQITGDRRWLEPPFTPRRDVSLIADEGAGLPDQVADEIRAAAIDAYRRIEAGQRPAITDPGDEAMVEMMSHCLGQEVPAEYAPLVREELGFADRLVDWPADAELRDGDVDHTVVIVGAGSSAIAMSHALGELGVDHVIVERRSSVGGVWRDNRYPGAGVDTPNHAYSFSFAPPRRWSRYFALQPELESYLCDTADAFGVTERIEFDTEVVGARWDAGCWRVETRPTARSSAPHESEPVPSVRSCRVLISAIGQLNVPVVPELPGIDRFEGPAFHSSTWPDDLDVAGLRVAVVGSGASANQIVPAIADRVEHLTILQRTAQWARPIPRYHDAIPEGSQWLFGHLPFYAAWFRFSMWWRYGDGLLPFLVKDPDWPRTDSINRINERHRQEMVGHIVDTIGDRPELLDACMPTYPPYGKRIVLDNGWFDALIRPNVSLVPEAVAELDESGVIDAAGDHHEVDVVVFATGFEVFQGAGRLGIVGRDGRSLADEWADDDPHAHLGITVPGFPNLFLLQGPTTGLGHGGSAIFQAECQVRYVTSCLAELARRGATAIEPTDEATAAYSARHDAEHDRLIWTHSAMRPWYRNDAGRVVAIMPFRLVDFWRWTHDVDLDDHLIHP